MDAVAIVRDELHNDTLSLGYKSLADAGDMGGALALLNTPNVSWFVVVQPCARRDLKELMLGRGTLLPIFASNTASASAVKLLFSDPDFPTINTANPIWGALVTALKADGLLNDDDITAITSLTNRSPASRAEVLLGPGASVSIDQLVLAFKLLGWSTKSPPH